MTGRLILGMEDRLLVTTEQNGPKVIDLILSHIRATGMPMWQDNKAETLPCLHQDPTFLITLIELL